MSLFSRLRPPSEEPEHYVTRMDESRDGRSATRVCVCGETIQCSGDDAVSRANTAMTRHLSHSR